MRSQLFVIFCCCLAVSVSGSRLLLQVVSTQCPAGCDTDSSPSGCIFDATNNGYKCVKCKGELVVNRVNGTCDCPLGRYADTDTCKDCDKNYYCGGGVYVSASVPGKTACSIDNSLLTIGKRASSVRACVNAPGYSYSVASNGAPSASLCDQNTYGPGLRKQRACVPCPPGYVTSGTGSTNATSCTVPAGYFIKSPGQIAPCPQGEWKGAGSNSSCNKCATGVTTLGANSTVKADCKVLVPGYYAKTIQGDGEISATGKCPQKYYCPGNNIGQAATAFTPASPNPDEVTIKVCPDDTWTRDLMATAVTQCLTPPGFKTTVGGGPGATVACDAGEYREDWVTPANASACTSCGTNILSQNVDQITTYKITDESTNFTEVAGSKGACYINQGMGIYFNAASQKFTARNCENNEYGVASTAYGLAANPCRACPPGMNTTTSTPSSTYHATNGFWSPLACVTQPGWGYNGRAAYKCRNGTYSAGNNYTACTECGEGLTSPDGSTASTDCIIAVGYGYNALSTRTNKIEVCPVGTYNDAPQPTLTTPCKLCSDLGVGLTTSGTGSTAAGQCNICIAGYGGVNCTTQCGGTSASATYNPAGADNNTACISCPAMVVGFAFDFMSAARDYNPAPVARLGASAASDCLAGYAQIQDTAWYLPSTSSTQKATAVAAATIAACATACDGDSGCMYVIYDETATGAECILVLYGGTAATTSTVAFKGVSYSETQAASLKKTKAKAIASGTYTFWNKVVDADKIGTQYSPPASAATLQDCLNACDADDLCAAVFTDATKSDGTGYTAANCKLVKGNTTLNTWQRTVTRAIPKQFVLPALP